MNMDSIMPADIQALWHAIGFEMLRKERCVLGRAKIF